VFLREKLISRICFVSTSERFIEITWQRVADLQMEHGQFITSQSECHVGRRSGRTDVLRASAGLDGVRECGSAGAMVNKADAQY
jgi:hypothetical protein